MAGTKEGSRKRLETIRSRKGGQEAMKSWARLGGMMSSSRTFATNPELASLAGLKSGKVRQARAQAKSETPEEAADNITASAP